MGRYDNLHIEGMTFGRQYLQWNTDSTAGTTNPFVATWAQGDFNTTAATSPNIQFSATTTTGTAFSGPLVSESYNQPQQWTNPSFTFNTGFSEIGKLKHALMQIFKKVPTDLIKSDEDKKLVKAKEKSEKLLKDWLSPMEYQGLIDKGELEIPSEDDEDIIFIIKKDPNSMVDVKKKGEYQHKLCLVAEDMDYPVGDQLLSKLMMLKTDQKKFKELAIKH